MVRQPQKHSVACRLTFFDQILGYLHLTWSPSFFGINVVCSYEYAMKQQRYGCCSNEIPVSQCLKGQCLSSIPTQAPPCTPTRSTPSLLPRLQAKPSRVGPHNTGVLLATQLPAQSSTNSTSRQRQVSTLGNESCDFPSFLQLYSFRRSTVVLFVIVLCSCVL